MNTSTARVAVVVASLSSGIASAQMPQTNPYNPSSPYPGQTPPVYGAYPSQPDMGQQTPKNPLLLALVVQPLLQQSGSAVASGVGRLFTRLFDALLGRTGGTTNIPTPNTPGVPGYMAGMPMPYGQSPQYGSSYPATYPSGMPGATMGASPPAASAYPPQNMATSPTYAAPTYGAPTYTLQSPPYGTPTSAVAPTGTAVGYPTGTTTAYPGSPVNTTIPPNPSTAPYMPGAQPAAPSSVSYMAGMPTNPVPGATAGGAIPLPPGMPPAAALPAVNKAVVLPSVVYSLDQLDPKKFTTTQHINIAAGTAPTLYTGDVFAIEYSTNLPGQLRIDNIDSAGTLAELGTYVMLPGRDNRIPIRKGIKLVGETGTEVFKMYFFPCVPEGRPGKDSASESLPTCPTGPSPQLLQASEKRIAAKGAVNLDSPDPTIAVAAVTDYQPNDVMVNEFRIKHIAPDPSPSKQ